MKEFVWTSEFETGIAEIDEQHKQIFIYIDELRASLVTTISIAAVRVALMRLVDYTISHFDFEESLQEKAGYEHLDAHKGVHKVFKKRIAQFVERADRGEDVIPELLSLLSVWLTTHIKHYDQDYVPTVEEIMPTPEVKAGWLEKTLKKFFQLKAA